MQNDIKKGSPANKTKGTTSSINYFSTKNLGYQHNIITTLERAALDNVWNRLNVANMPVASFTLRKRRNLFDYARIVMDEYNILGKSFGNKNFSVISFPLIRPLTSSVSMRLSAWCVPQRRFISQNQTGF